MLEPYFLISNFLKPMQQSRHTSKRSSHRQESITVAMLNPNTFVCFISEYWLLIIFKMSGFTHNFRDQSDFVWRLIGFSLILFQLRTCNFCCIFVVLVINFKNLINSIGILKTSPHRTHYSNQNTLLYQECYDLP